MNKECNLCSMKWIDIDGVSVPITAKSLFVRNLVIMIKRVWDRISIYCQWSRIDSKILSSASGMNGQ